MFKNRRKVVNRALFSTLNIKGLDEIKLTALFGFSRNQSYLIEKGDEKYILRILYKLADIHEVSNTIEAAKAGIGPKVFYPKQANEDGVLILEFIQNKPLHLADIENNEHFKNIVHCVRNLHQSKCEFTPRVHVSDMADHYYNRYSHKIKASWIKNLLQSRLAENRADLDQFPSVHVSCHGDLNINNILQASNKFYLIDWEDSRFTGRFYDLASLTIFNGLTEKRMRLLLHYYFDGKDTESDYQHLLSAWKNALLMLTSWLASIVPSKSIDAIDAERLPKKTREDFHLLLMKYLAEKDSGNMEETEFELLKTAISYLMSN